MMGKLIDRDVLLAECAEAQKSDPNFEGRGWANHFINAAGEPSAEWYAVEDMIENAPAVDAAPVVRCKDCKYWALADRYDGLGYGACTYYKTIVRKGVWLNENFFCSDGKRKDGGDDDANT